MEFIKKERKNLLAILFVFAFTAFVFQHRTIGLYVDFGREAFFPKAVLDGEVLYKDIFNIFGPFSYLFNAFMYKIFGVKLSTLYLAGCLNALSIAFAFYYILRNFFDEKLSLVLNLFVIEFCFFTTTLMNYITPYSYALVYGLNFLLVSVCFYLAFLNGRKEKIQYLYGTFLFAGLAFANKYEFFLYFVLLIFILFKDKVSFKNSSLLILTSFAPTAFLFLFLAQQGLRLSDFITYLHFFKKYVTSPGLNEFYVGSLYFSTPLITTMIMAISIAIVMFLGLYFLIKFTKNKTGFAKNFPLILYGAIVVSGMCYFRDFFGYYFFSYLTIFVCLLYLFKIKDIFKDTKRFFVITAAIIPSLKVFGFLYTTDGYGQYFLPLLLIAVFLLLQDFYFSNDFSRLIFKKTATYFLFFMLISSVIFNSTNVLEYRYKLFTPKGIILTKKYDAMTFQLLIDWLKKNTKKTDKIVVLPETALLNFLLDRKSDNNFNVLKPEGIDTYGEPYIISYFEKTPPEYFVIIGSKSDENLFSVKYAKDLGKWISQNYKGVYKLDGAQIIRVYKKE